MVLSQGPDQYAKWKVSLALKPVGSKKYSATLTATYQPLYLIIQRRSSASLVSILVTPIWYYRNPPYPF